MNLTRNSAVIGVARRSLIVAGCALIAATACVTALALQVNPPAPPPQSAQAENGAALEVKPGEMMGNLLTKVAPVYPPFVKAARVQGTVIIDATIGKDGRMENVEAVSGPVMLRQSAMDAVKQWTYKPYLLNGSPVEVTTKINVIFTLGDKPMDEQGTAEEDHSHNDSGPAAESAPEAAQNSAPVDAKSVDLSNNLLTHVDPVYPAAAKKDKINGVVLLSFTIDQDGAPKDIQVEKSLRDDFDQSAMDALRQYRWKPFLLNGSPVEIKLKMEFNFKLY